MAITLAALCTRTFVQTRATAKLATFLAPLLLQQGDNLDERSIPASQLVPAAGDLAVLDVERDDRRTEAAERPLGQSTPSAAEMPSGGLLGNFGQPVGGLLDNAWTATSGPMARNLPTFPQSSASAGVVVHVFAGRLESKPLPWRPTSTANVEFPMPPARTFNRPLTDLFARQEGRRDGADRTDDCRHPQPRCRFTVQAMS